MIFIAGMQPKVKKLDDNPRRCPQCGSDQAVYQRIDHFFSLFFIPLLRVKTGEPFVACNACGLNIFLHSLDRQTPNRDRQNHCQHCGGRLKPSFHYCPFCGRPV